MSRISHKHKFIFFSFPKTGSESIRKLLNPVTDVKSTIYTKITDKNPFYSHITPKETKEAFKKKGWNWDAYTKFVFVRNPYARVVSLYNMVAKGQDFKEWLKTLRNDGDGGCLNPNQKWKVYGAYSLINFISDEHGNVLVDKIIKLEDINEEFPNFMWKNFRLRVPNIPQVNKGNYNKKSYREYFDEESKQIVENLYKYEIETFGYTF